MARMDALLIGARLMLAGVFATAGLAKLADRAGTRSSLQRFGVPAASVGAAALLLPVAEIATAVALIPQPTARWGAVAGMVLLVAFIVAIANAVSRGKAPECNCFGNVHSAPAGKGTIARNVALAVAAGYVTVDGPGPAIHTWVGERDADGVATAAILTTVTLTLVSARLWAGNRELRRSLDDARSELVRLPPGLPVGADAPGFESIGFDASELSLKSLTADGRPVVLIFVASGCGACEGLLPLVDRWQAMLSDQITIAVVDDPEVLKLYRVSGTPSAVAVTPDQRIASVPADGPPAIETLVRLQLRSREPVH